MDTRISVRLTSPAKIGEGWHREGDEVAVTPDVARELAAAGVIADADGVALTELAPGMPGYDEAVQAMAKTLADAAVSAAVEHATRELTEDRDAARIRADKAEAAVNRLEAQVMRLEAEIADRDEQAKASAADTPTPKAAPKKAAGTAKG